MIRCCRTGRSTAGVVLVAALALGVVGCGSNGPRNAMSATTSTVVATRSANLLPPAVNNATVVPSPVSRLHPGIQVLVGEGSTTSVCTAGFYVNFPDPNDPGRRRSGFVTAAQCAHGDGHAPVAVMKVEDAGFAPTQTKIGEMAYLTAGDASPRVAGEPWTIQISPLAVFSSGQGDWVLPVAGTVNDQPPTAQTVQTVDAAQHGRVPAAWTGLDGSVATGRVLDPAAIPELRVPIGIARVVVAHDMTTPIDDQIIGAPVTAEIGGATQNLGIITGIDEVRHWVVVDLIGPFLARQSAELVVDR